MLLDTLSAPALTLLLSLSFIAILLIYERYNMQTLVKEAPILSTPTPSLPSKSDCSTNTTSTCDSSDIGVLSYLLYHAFGNRDSNANSDRPSTAVSTPKAPPAVRTRSPHKRGSRGGRAKGKHTKHTQVPQSKGVQSKPTSASLTVGLLPRARQSYDYFLVFDVEATCVQGQDFNWCNEIIEFPVVLLRWGDKTADGKASTLVKVDEFHSYVRPTFRPALSDFCTSLTGIYQSDVDCAPTFSEMIPQFKEWLVKHNLLCPRTERKLQRFMWCTDGPFDIRDFVVKQCFISKMKVPQWLRTDVLDVRRVVSDWAVTRDNSVTHASASSHPLSSLESRPSFPKAPKPQHYRRPSLNITSQLNALSLPPFMGRQHSGIDDTRNIARIVTELARIGTSLDSNLNIDPGRRWYWMGPRPGDIWEEYL